MQRVLTSVIFFFLTALLFLSCEKESPVSPKDNIPPKTFLWIQTDTTQNLTPVISRQVVRWWGEDPDGWIRGYLFTYFNADSFPSNQIPDTISYTWNVKNDSLIAFPLLAAYERFTVFVRAVDNTFRDSLNAQAMVRLKPEPYWDKNRNGILDNGDLRLNSLSNAIDPIGAKQIFPIKNSPPTVEFSKGPDPNDPINMITIQQPETTFTVATFSWTGSDLDGDHTLRAFRINLNNPNDSSAWFEFPSTNSMITLEVPRSRSDEASGIVDADVYAGIFPTMRKLGTVAGLKLDDTNKIYLQAKDIAGEYSPTVSLPEGNKIWYVKKPKSQLLTIVNYDDEDLLDVLLIYRKAFAAIDTFPNVDHPRNFGNFDMLDIKRKKMGGKVGDLVPSILNPAFVLTLKLYPYIFWFTDIMLSTEIEQNAVAEFPIYLYAGSGGKMLYTTRLEKYLGDFRTNFIEFAPVDAFKTIRTINPNYPTESRVPNDWPLEPNPKMNYPPLRFTQALPEGFQHPLWIWNVIKRSGAEYLYSIPPVPGRTWIATPNIAVIDVEKRFVFMSMPLHLMDGLTKRPNNPGVDGEGIAAFLKRVFIDEFGG